MTPDGIITLLSLCVAVYAVLPRSRRLEMPLVFQWFDVVILVFSSLVAFHFLFYPSFHAPIEWTLIDVETLIYWSINPSYISFIVILFMGAYSFFRSRYGKLPSRKVGQFRLLIEELINEEQYVAVFKLLDKHFTQLVRIYNEDFWLYKVHHFLKQEVHSPSYIRNCSTAELQAMLQEGALQERLYKSVFETIKLKTYSYLQDRVPNGEKWVVEIDAMFRVALQDKHVIRALVSLRPHLGLKMITALENNIWVQEGFIERYFEELVNQQGSILYQEIFSTCSYESGTDRFAYLIEPSNKITHFLFEDVRVAEKTQIYRPVSEAVVLYIESLGMGEVDPYNQPLSRVDNTHDINSCPVFLALHFFDIMIRASLRENIKWHMWLHYHSVFLEKILANIVPNAAGVDYGTEWPTRYHHLIYGIFDGLLSWLEILDYLPDEQANTQLENSRLSNENGNIPKSTLLEIGRCLKLIVTSPKLDKRFKRNCLHQVLRCYFNFTCYERGDREEYLQLFRLTIRDGGISWYHSHDDNYSKELIELISMLDLVDYVSCSQDVDQMMNFLKGEE